MASRGLHRFPLLELGLLVVTGTLRPGHGMGYASAITWSEHALVTNSYSHFFYHVHAVDIDGDGDIDVFAADGGTGDYDTVKWWENEDDIGESKW